MEENYQFYSPPTTPITENNWCEKYYQQRKQLEFKHQQEIASLQIYFQQSEQEQNSSNNIISPPRTGNRLVLDPLNQSYTTNSNQQNTYNSVRIEISVKQSFLEGSFFFPFSYQVSVILENKNFLLLKYL